MPARNRQTVAYRLYMGSPLWQLRRWLWFITSDRRCEDCGRRITLHRAPAALVMTVHHKHYRTLGRERRTDVALLCWPCHCKRQPWKARA